MKWNFISHQFRLASNASSTYVFVGQESSKSCYWCWSGAAAWLPYLQAFASTPSPPPLPQIARPCRTRWWWIHLSEMRQYIQQLKWCPSHGILGSVDRVHGARLKDRISTFLTVPQRFQRKAFEVSHTDLSWIEAPALFSGSQWARRGWWQLVPTPNATARHDDWKDGFNQWIVIGFIWSGLMSHYSIWTATNLNMTMKEPAPWRIG